MAMPDYPNTYPVPEHSAYGGVLDEGLLRSDVESAQANQSKRFNSPRTEISLTFKMVNDDYKTWLTWVRNNAYDWFNLPIISGNTPTDITSTHRVRFISDIAYQKLGDNWIQLTVTIEMVPGDWAE